MSQEWLAAIEQQIEALAAIQRQVMRRRETTAEATWGGTGVEATWMGGIRPSLHERVGAAWMRDAWRVFCSSTRSSALEAAEQALLSSSSECSEHRYWKQRKSAESEVVNRLRVAVGSLRAIGKPQQATADFVWIPPEMCFRLQSDPDDANVLRGENIVFWDVIVVDPAHLFFRTAMTPAVTSAVPEQPTRKRRGAVGNPANPWLRAEIDRRLNNRTAVAANMKTGRDLIAAWQSEHPNRTPPNARAVTELIRRTLPARASRERHE